MGGLTQYVPLIIFMGVVGLLNYPLAKALIKRRQWWIWVLPLIFLTPAVIFIVLGFLSEGWGVLGYLIYGFILLAAAIAAGISSWIVHLKQK